MACRRQAELWRSPRKVEFILSEEFHSPTVLGSTGESLSKVRMAVPADVRVREHRLEWIPASVGDEVEWWPDGKAANRALSAFIELAEDPDDAKIASFAKSYGVLGLMTNGLPGCGSSHPLDGPPHLAEPWQGCAVSWEPVEAYRLYAKGFKAMAIAQAALHRARNEEAISITNLFSNSGLPTDPTATWQRFRAVADTWQRETGLTWEDWWETRNGASVFMNLDPLDPALIAHNLDYRKLQGDGSLRQQRRQFAYWFTQLFLKRAGITPELAWADENPILGLPVGSKRKDRSPVEVAS